jgi:hypothetical protein
MPVRDPLVRPGIPAWSFAGETVKRGTSTNVSRSVRMQGKGEALQSAEVCKGSETDSDFFL